MGKNLKEWKIPYNSFQVDVIIANYKKSGFPCFKVIEAIRRWPWNLALSVSENYNTIEEELLNLNLKKLNMSQIVAAAKNHDIYRQEVINRMKFLILDTNASKDLLLSPLMKLERNIFNRTHAFRFVRKHFSFLLPKRKRKKRKRSKAQMDKKMTKKRQKQTKAKNAKRNPIMTVPCFPITDQSQSFKVAEPGITLEAMRTHFSKKQPRLTSWHPLPTTKLPKTSFY